MLEFRRLLNRLFLLMKKLLAITTACILIVTLVRGQGAGRALFLPDSLNQYVNKALTYWRIPGAAICIIKDGKIVLMHGYGIRELGLNDRVTDKTLFMIGDNTKAFTATALGILQANGRLTLDDRIIRFLPEFKTANKTAATQATIRDLLTQRMGFESNAGNFTFYNTNLSPDQVIQRTALLSQPYALRSKWTDVNADYVIAGEIIPWASGKTWDAYIKENIFDQLGMTGALALSRDMAGTSNKAVPHTIIDGRLTAIPYARLDAMDAAGGICASVSDLSKWVMALLDEGRLNGRQALPNAAVQATLQPEIAIGNIRMPNGENSQQQYGMGWVSEKYSGHELAMSDGSINGYRSSITLVPDAHLGIIILTNTDKNQFPAALRWDLLDVFFNRPYKNYNDAYLRQYKLYEAKRQLMDNRYRDSAAYNLQPTMSMESYQGRYHNNLYGDVFVTRGEGNDLEMRFEHHPKMYAKLQPLGGNRFYAVFSDPLYGKTVIPFAFQSGRITGVTVNVDRDVEKTLYYFSKVD